MKAPTPDQGPMGARLGTIRYARWRGDQLREVVMDARLYADGTVAIYETRVVNASPHGKSLTCQRPVREAVEFARKRHGQITAEGYVIDGRWPELSESEAERWLRGDALPAQEGAQT